MFDGLISWRSQILAVSCALEEAGVYRRNDAVMRNGQFRACVEFGQFGVQACGEAGIPLSDLLGTPA